MRKEFFSYVPSPQMATLNVVIGAVWGAAVGLFLLLGILNSPTPDFFFISKFVSIIGFVVIFWGEWMKEAISRTSPHWRQMSMRSPVIIIDDSGLWFREICEPMRWTEIQSIKLSDETFDIVCKRPPAFPLSAVREAYSDGDGNLVFDVHIPCDHYMDRDGVFWWPYSVSRVMRKSLKRGREVPQ